MKFKPAAPDEYLRLRFVSEEGKWEIGLAPVLFGIRVQMGFIGDGYYPIVYCAGADEGFALILLATVVQILDRYPEDIKPSQLQHDFPTYVRKPINLDPECWIRLQQMAGILPDDVPSIACPRCHKLSYNPNDILQRYCGYCHQFHEFMEVIAHG